eukprot:CAMPEP_0174898254 /NCGR_PEP_ID=MMETSP0167-20121228/20375_1 /TAXON_ID=38298 /ORGANISM="Rhodella maculata, Strain CCMP736" /LENGTH=197 /DNA_ID=CAMNT_0016138751 /DNA_START=490 /DNA_END=1081 /DNA_ORIENTATION=-
MNRKDVLVPVAALTEASVAMVTAEVANLHVDEPRVLRQLTLEPEHVSAGVAPIRLLLLVHRANMIVEVPGLPKGGATLQAAVLADAVVHDLHVLLQARLLREPLRAPLAGILAHLVVDVLHVPSQIALPRKHHVAPRALKLPTTSPGETGLLTIAGDGAATTFGTTGASAAGACGTPPVFAYSAAITLSASAFGSFA